MATFGESIDPTAAISAILGTYPFSIGLIREILQNSDDAKALKQILILDRRNHPQQHLAHEALQASQGPALIAYNDSLFSDEDWVALQRIHQSSKKTDTGKIGKYGVGFRSSYHITDAPQILSGETLAILDPHHAFSDTGGLRVDVTTNSEAYIDHFAAFNLGLVAPAYAIGTPFPGTIIRLPLRLDASISRISTKVVEPDEIKTLLSNFVQEEIGIAMLFLSHISMIEIFEVDESDRHTIGCANIYRNPPVTFTPGHAIAICSVSIQHGSSSVDTDWNVLHANYDLQECVNILNGRLGYETSPMLTKEKLSPSLSLAIQASLPKTDVGRLFTFLPLPLPTGFPCHIHALFALTQARQNLRNGSERGMVKGTTDELLPEWNRVLFDVFIPRAWCTLLVYLSGHMDPQISIFNVWPPAPQDASGGDPEYWNNLPVNVLREAIRVNADIWPCIAKGTHYFAPPTKVLFETKFAPYVPVLSAAGVRITIPPSHVVEMIRNVDESCTWLSPQSAYQQLLAPDSSPESLSSEAKTLLLDFLLSNSDVSLLVSIRVVPQIDGGHVALGRRADGSEVYTMLSANEQAVFGGFDPNAIHLSMLTPSARGILAAQGPKYLNVSLLNVDTVIRYVMAAADRYTLTSNTSLTQEVTNWVNIFWTWLPDWQLHESLLQQIGSFNLIPTIAGTLAPVKNTVFESHGIDDDVMSAMMKAGLDFLSKSFPLRASAVLRKYGSLVSSEQLSVLLEHLQPCKLKDFTQAESLSLLRHMLACARKSSPLSNKHKALLRSLPTFPVLSAPDDIDIRNHTIKLGHVPEDTTIYCVDTSTIQILSMPAGLLLPFIIGSVFVAHVVDDIDVYPLLNMLGTNKSPISKVSEFDIVTLFVDNLPSQPKSQVVAFLQQLVAHSSSVPPRVFASLSLIEFVTTVEHSLRAPGSLIDPKSSLSELFEPTDPRLPASHDALDEQMVHHLSALSLLRRELKADIVEERLQYLCTSSSRNVSGLSMRLLRLLDHAPFDYSSVTSGFDMKWLPTKDGLRSPSETRDDHVNHSQSLFDRVWSILLPDVAIRSQSLRTALGWSSSIPLDVIQLQMVRELDQGTIPLMGPRLEAIIREFGRRVVELRNHPILHVLKEAVASRSWIPVNDKTLSSTSRTILSYQFIPPGFHAAPVSLLGSDGVRDLLLLLGCTEKARPSAIIEELHSLTQTDKSLESSLDVTTVVELLRAISHTTLEKAERDQLLVPDVRCNLRPLDGLYYNDLGGAAHRLELPKNRSNCHTAISLGLAARLRIQTLSSLNLKAIELDADDEDMYEDLTHRISNVLKQYSVEQAFNEFLANAADAGATEYNVLTDSRPAASCNLLSPLMSEMQTLPALVIHNDAIFQERDFKGIRSIGMGGKEGRSDTIGKFGLGALSAFHFTEVLMIVSGADVMFLDPSQKYLPTNGDRKRRALRLPISRMRVLYKDHLVSLAGLFGFDPDCDSYPGTLFRFPLRSRQQALQSALSSEYHAVSQVNKLIANYWNSAPESLLFIHVHTIAAWSRTTGGNLHKKWLTQATRSTIDSNEDDYHCSRITIEYHYGMKHGVSQDWHVVARNIRTEDIPTKFQHFATKHHLRNVAISVAGRMSQPSLFPYGQEQPQYRFYSRLPLPTLSSLPVHIDASWILAEDRRSLRFDESGQVNLESQYNTWILTEGLPDVYGAFLTSWPNAQNLRVWPGYPSTPEDPITRVFVQAFYKNYLKASGRPIFTSLTGCRMAFAQSIFQLADMVDIRPIIDFLQPKEVADFPLRLQSKLPSNSFRVIDADFMREIIARCTSFQSAYHAGKLSLQSISSLIRWMLAHSPPALHGLQVLPLADKTLGSIHPNGAGSLTFGDANVLHPPWPLFPTSRFLDPSLQSSMFYGRSLNVDRFSSAHVASLLREKLPAGGIRTLSAQNADFVKNFWANYNYLPIQISDITTLPLIQIATRSTQFASLTHCISGYALTSISDHTTAAWIQPMFEGLGATIIDYHAIHSTLPLDARKKLADLGSSLGHMLNFLRTLGMSTISTKLKERLSSETLSQFATFARQNFTSLQKAELVRTGGKRKKWKTVVTITHEDVARELPIWPAFKNGDSILVHASDPTLRMLPSSLALQDAQRYLSPSFSFVNYNSNLATFPVVHTVSYSDMSNFQFPMTIEEQDIAAYKNVLGGILLYSTFALTGLTVPNQNRVFVNPNTLYASSVGMFREALAHHSNYFLHSDLRSLEDKLSGSGLHTAVDFSTFKTCAQTVQDDRSRHPDGSENRARVVFDYYNDHLWQVIGGNMSRWEELNTVSFIPRSAISRNYPSLSFASSQWAKDLPAVVSPSELVRPEHEAVAWTQRGLFPTAPSQRLLLANTTLGIPTAIEVVDHLCKLRFIAQEHPFNKCLTHDLTETYKWLQTNIDEAQAPLITYRDQPLFLNVDRTDPAAALEWNFVSASRLIFNGPDEGERRRVRVYLSQFRNLLVAVGAKEVISAVRPELQLSPAEEVLKRFRAAFDLQRRNEQFTDVILISSDDQEFVAHRTVLAAASPHFEILFSGPWAETRGDVKVVPVPEVSSNILQAITDYIYTGTLQNIQDQDELKELLELSDAWEMKELFSIIENELITTITLDTCREVHEVGERYNAENLVKACENFEKDNAHILKPSN